MVGNTVWKAADGCHYFDRYGVHVSLPNIPTGFAVERLEISSDDKSTSN